MTVAYRETAVQMEDLNETLTMLLSQTAEELARETRFVQRRSPLNGSLFARTLILGWLANPEASYGQLRELLAMQGCDISEQALEQRLSERSADFLLSLLHAFVGECIGSEPVMIELLRRFEGVYVQDGSVITLPAALEGLYKGCGGRTEKSGCSGLRLQVRLNLSTGVMEGPWIQEAVECERKGAGTLSAVPVPSHGLYLVDSGLLNLRLMKELGEQGVWWLTHARADLAITTMAGVKAALPQFIQQRASRSLMNG